MVINLSKFFLISSIIVVFDQIGKFLVVGQQLSTNIIPGILSITYTQNTGIAFGLLKGNNLVLAIVSAVVAIGIIVYRKKLENGLEQMAAALILGGALSNLIDRLLRGFVVDYISVPLIPTFNIADAALTAGAALIITRYIMQKYKK